MSDVVRRDARVDAHRDTDRSGVRISAPTACWIAAVAALVVFAPALHGGFVYDDHRFLETNPHLGETSILWRAFGDPACQTSDGTHAGLWRPLRTLSFALDRLVFGGAAWGPHAVNVALHAAGAALVARLLLAWRVAPVAAALGATLYALHPAQAECVAWISSRGDVLAAAFVWGALVADLDERPRLGWALGAAALLSKEQAVVWPVLAALSQFAAGAGARRAWRAARVPLVLTAVFVVVRHLLLTDPLQQGGLGQGAPGVPVLGSMLAHQAWVAFVPVRLLFDWQMPFVRTAPAPAACVALLVAAGLFVRATRAPVAWFLAGIAPTWALQAFVPLNILVADRFLLFSLPAVAWVAARGAASSAGAAAAVGVVAASMGVLTWNEVPKWRSDTSLFGPTAAAMPGHPRANTWLGIAALRDGRADDAESHLALAAGSAPGDATARYHLAAAQEIVARRLGQDGEVRLVAALANYRAAIAAFGRPRAEGAGELLAAARWAEPDLLLVLGKRDESRAAIEALLAGAPLPGERSPATSARAELLARRAETFLDRDLAARIRRRFAAGADR